MDRVKATATPVDLPAPVSYQRPGVLADDRAGARVLLGAHTQVPRLDLLARRASARRDLGQRGRRDAGVPGGTAGEHLGRIAVAHDLRRARTAAGAARSTRGALRRSPPY